RNGAKHKKILISILIFNVIAFISLLINLFWLTGMEFLISLSYLLRLNVYMSLLFIGIFNFNKLQPSLLKKAFIASSFTVVFLGFIQYFFYNDLRNLYYLGWDDHLYRMFSTFLDPNFVGLFFAML